jgi:hypothetical protein
MSSRGNQIFITSFILSNYSGFFASSKKPFLLNMRRHYVIEKKHY